MLREIVLGGKPDGNFVKFKPEQLTLMAMVGGFPGTISNR